MNNKRKEWLKQDSESLLSRTTMEILVQISSEVSMRSCAHVHGNGGVALCDQI